MQFTPIPIGSLNWGAPVNNAFTAQAAVISEIEMSGATAEDHNLQAWTYDPRGAANSSVLTTGSLTMMRISVQKNITTASARFYVSAAGVTLTAGQNFVALYNAAGAQVAITADQTANWGSVALNSPAWTAPAALTPGFYYMAFLTNGATGIGLAREANLSADLLNVGLSAADSRWSVGGTGLTGLTAMPASVTMANRATSAMAFWAGLAA